MNPLIETLNRFGENALRFAWPMLWQSSVLIAVLYALDFVLRRRVRAAVRYAFWLVLLVKLLLPPSLALPTGLTWWLLPATASAKPHTTKFVVSYEANAVPSLPPQPIPAFMPPPSPPLSTAAWTILVWSAISAGLLIWLTVRWRQVAGDVKRAMPAPEWIEALFNEVKSSTGLRCAVRLRLTDEAMSPAVCRLFRPVILLPQSLVQKLTPEQLRAVLLHELTHLRRGDVWMNCAQALVQIAYWWHPLLWLANARIRRVREEAVDDAVMLTLRDDAEVYAPTLLEVAKLAFHRPLASLGLVGILESRSALRQRIERLMDFRAPRKAGLTLVSMLGILAFTALAVPMGKPPISVGNLTVPRKTHVNPFPDPNYYGYSAGIPLQPQFLIVDASRIGSLFPSADAGHPLVIASNELANFDLKLSAAGAQSYNFSVAQGWVAMENPPSGLRMQWQIGDCTNSAVSARTRNAGGDFTNILTGWEGEFPATHPDWIPMDFILIPRINGDSVRCHVELALRNNPSRKQQAEITIPAGGGLLWATADGTKPGKYQLVVLHPFGAQEIIAASATPTDAAPSLSSNPSDAAGSPAADNTNPTAPAWLIPKRMIALFFRPGGSNSAPSETRTLKADTNDLTGQTAQLFKLDHPIRSDALKAKLLAAGVKLPPTIIHYTDNGILLARGSKEQLALVLQEVMKLNRPSAAKAEAAGKNFIPSESALAMADQAATNLETRTFKVDPNVFARGLENSMPGSTASTNIGRAAKQFLTSLGLNLDPPKSVFFNDRLGVLFVRATRPDLDAAEKAVMFLTYTPPQIHIKARFIEVPEQTAPNLGTNLIPTGATNVTGILTEPNFRVAIHALEQSPGVEDRAEPEVTIASGRQVQMRATDIFTVVTNFVFQETGTNGAIVPQQGTIECGPMVDTVASVLPDGYTIDLKVSTSLTDFLGYAEATNTIPTNNSAGAIIEVPTIHPNFSVSQADAHVKIWDNQTVVLGGMVNSQIRQVKTKVPILGDLPLAGRLFRSESKTTIKQNLLVFVTATIVDQVGNRVHSEEEMPFAIIGIPPQASP